MVVLFYRMRHEDHDCGPGTRERMSDSLDSTLNRESGTADRRAGWFVLVTVVLDAMGLGLLIPVIPVLIQQLTGQGLAEAAVYGGWLTAVFACVQFFAAPVLGSLSDHFGRRPVLLVSLCAFGLSYLLMSVAPTLGWLFLAQALTGLFGATPSTAGAYIADVTQPGERTRRFGAMAAAFGTGLVIGPVMGGLLVSYHTRLPFLAAAGLSLISVAWGYFVLPESLPRERRRPFSWGRANPVGAFREVNRYAGAALLLGAALLQRVASGAMPAIWPYFTMELYLWSPRTVGWSLAAFGLSTVFAQAVLIRHFDRRFGSAGTACIGLLCLMTGYLGIAFGSGPWMLALCIPLATMGFMAGPALASILSGKVEPNAQGALQGVLASVNGAAAILTPLLIPLVFKAFSKPEAPIYFPGMPYLLATALAGAGIFLIVAASRRMVGAGR
jgi:DHA1 family tetracycline resistance protein-like MFS transporter